MTELLLYGANGYTGTLIAERACALGLRPVLAGRSEEKLRPLAARLGLPHRAFGLDQPDLGGARLVLHCAGPFSQTSRAMVDACLAQGAHYLDVTGEIDVFEAVLARGAEARERKVVLLPGVGFDVVPSDCLALLLKEALPSATELELAFAPGGGASRGTLKTAVEQLPKGGRVRRGGVIRQVPAAAVVREIPFADKPRRAMSIPWGDVSTAFHSTGIGNITVYLAAGAGMINVARATRFAGPALGLGPVQALLKRAIEAFVVGPAQLTGRVELWGRVSDGTHAKEATLRVPHGYAFTAEAALACAQRVLAGEVPPGAWTPAGALGARFVLGLSGVSLNGPA
jgi:short subunit dehydrogenase-like uncharacterized protein